MSNRKRQQKMAGSPLHSACSTVLQRQAMADQGHSPCAFSHRFCAVKSGAAGGGSLHARPLLGGLHAGHLRPRHHGRTAESSTNDGKYPVPCRINLSATRSRWGQRLGQKDKSKPFRLRFVLFATIRSADFPLFPPNSVCSNPVLGQKWVSAPVHINFIIIGRVKSVPVLFRK